MGGGPAARVALLRFSGELSTKARATRLQFRARLVHNLRDALSGEAQAPRLEVSHTRIFAHLPDATGQGDERALRDATGQGDERALRDHPLTRVFGLQSVSFVERHPAPDLETVVSTGEALFREQVRGRRFAIRARRVGDRHTIPVRSSDVARELGSALLPVSAGVDLSNPEVSAYVELSEGMASYFTERIPGPGGLPLGVEGRAVALLSGGFDSAVAAWQLSRRGVALDFVFCNLGGQTHLQGVVRVAKVLADRWSYGHSPRLHAIDFEPIAAAIRESTETRYWQVILKRMMLRAAQAVAVERRAIAIVTGDAVGQVSSQTLQNLAVVSRATQMPILRPLVGANKDEIIALAERIGTFDLSKVVGEYCAMVPRRPATRAALETVEEQETRLEPGLAEKAAAARSVLDLRAIDIASLDVPGLDIERPPPDSQLIDLRSLNQYRAGHHPDALHLDFAKALDAFPRFDRDRVYVLSCEFGLMSAHLAERMRRAGFRVHSLRGGQTALMRLAKLAD